MLRLQEPGDRHAEPLPARPVPDAPAAAPASVLALQRQAGNQAVARWMENPGWKRTDPRPPSRKNGWRQNGKDPQGLYLLEDGGKWFRYDHNKKAWVAAEAPGAAAPEPEKPKDPMAGFEPDKYDIPEGEEQGRLPTERATPEQYLPDSVVDYVVEHLPAQDQLAVRLVAKRLVEVGSTAMRKHLEGRLKLEALSSTRTGSMAAQFKKALKDRSPDKLEILADQIDPGTLNQLLSPITKTAVTAHRGEERGPHGGRPPARGGSSPLSATQLKGPVPTNPSSKMHIKSMVGTRTPGTPEQEKAETRPTGFLATGSPNITYSGMNLNTESAVMIDFKGIAKLFEEYMGLVKGGTGASSKEGQDFGKRLETFNERNPVGIRAALSPFVNILDQLDTELKGADTVIMRMFLVSLAESKSHKSPVDALIKLKTENPTATVRVVVDENQAQTQGYVWDALQKLQKAGVEVAYETGPGRARNPGIMHDKLIFAHHPATAEEKERYTVMVGSSGVTRNVAQDLNYENLLIIDDQKLFDELLKHDQATEGQRTTL